MPDAGGCSSMAEQKLPKLTTRVRFSSRAPGFRNGAADRNSFCGPSAAGLFTRSRFSKWRRRQKFLLRPFGRGSLHALQVFEMAPPTEIPFAALRPRVSSRAPGFRNGAADRNSFCGPSAAGLFTRSRFSKWRRRQKFLLRPFGRGSLHPLQVFEMAPPTEIPFAALRPRVSSPAPGFRNGAADRNSFCGPSAAGLFTRYSALKVILAPSCLGKDFNSAGA